VTRRWLLLFAFALLPAAAGAADAPPQWVVVTAPAFRAALEPLCEHRKAQGLKVTVVETTDVLTPKEAAAGDGGKLRARVNKLCRDYEGPSYVLLVGAIEAGKLDSPEKKVLPPLAGTVSRMKGQPSDNGYGCPDDKSLVPTVAVGRFPVRSEEECKGMVAKTLAYEKDDRPGRWKRRVSVLAGVPAYNPVVDKLVEGLAMARFDRIDPAWTGRAIYHNDASRFCVPDEVLNEKSRALVEEGQALTLYLGHSDPNGQWGGSARYLDREDWGNLKISRGAGVFATFGCNGCQLSGEGGEGYGVAAARNPNGPAAALGSHGICFAAMVNLGADGLFDSLFSGKVPARLGDVWLDVKRSVATRKLDYITYKALDAVDGDANIPLAVQRQEHLEMFVLLGDPALKLPILSDDVRLEAGPAVAAGKTLEVTGDVPDRLAGAKVVVTLERTPSSEPADLEPLPKEGSERAKVMLANHEKANAVVLARQETEARGGRFVAKLMLPDKLPWKKVVVRAYAATDRAESQGVLALPVPAADR
jgi:hypothetical protein